MRDHCPDFGDLTWHDVTFVPSMWRAVNESYRSKQGRREAREGWKCWHRSRDESRRVRYGYFAHADMADDTGSFQG